MRGNIIEELYYGNIDPQDRGYRPKSPVKKASDSLNDLEEMYVIFRIDDPNTIVSDFLQFSNHIRIAENNKSEIIY